MRWSALLLLFLPCVVQAEDALLPATAAMVDKKPTVELPTVKWTGQFQADMIGFSQDEASRAQYGLIPNAVGFRRARIGMFGEYGVMDYRI
jgi:hypothetical protein